MLAIPRSILVPLLPLAIVAVVSSAPYARADVIMPGEHAIEHRITFEKADDLRGYDFYLFPVVPWSHERKFQKIEIGKPVRFHKDVAPQVFAIPTGTAETSLDNKYFERKDVPRSELRLYLSMTASDGDATRTIRTAYRIEGVAKGKVHVKLVSEERVDANGKKVASAGWGAPGTRSALVLVSLVGVAGIARRRRGRASA